MKTIAFTDINTLEGFKVFLQAYHQQLVDQRSFPPLGTQKALHTAAPVFGYNDWHVMSSQIGVEKSTLHTAISGVEKSTRSESELDIDFLARTHWIEFTDRGDKWGWRSLHEVDESASGWATKEDAWANACEHYDIENPLEGQVSDEVPAPAPIEALEQPLHVVTVTVTTLETNHATLESVETKVFRGWDKAQAYIGDIVRSKVMHNDRTTEEICDCMAIDLPGDDERLGMNADELLQWILEHNEISQLIQFIAYLDYGLTTLAVDEDWI